MTAGVLLTLGTAAAAATSADCGDWRALVLFLVGVILPQPSHIISKLGGKRGPDGSP